SKVQPSPVQALVFTGKKPKPAETTNASETIVAPPETAPPAAAPPVPTPAANVPADSAVSVPSQVRPTPPAAPNSTSIERTVQQSESPQHPADPPPTAPSNPVASAPTPNPETASPGIADTSNASNSTPAETAQKSAPPPQDISTGVAVPENSLLSNKVIWIG